MEASEIAMKRTEVQTAMYFCYYGKTHHVLLIYNYVDIKPQDQELMDEVRYFDKSTLERTPINKRHLHPVSRKY